MRSPAPLCGQCRSGNDTGCALWSIFYVRKLGWSDIQYSTNVITATSATELVPIWWMIRRSNWSFFLRINIPQSLGLYHKFINAATSTWTHIRTLRTAHASSNVRHLSPLSMAKESSENWCIHRKRIPSSIYWTKENNKYTTKKIG